MRYFHPIILMLLLPALLVGQTTNQTKMQKVKAGGGMTDVYLTPVDGSLIGWSGTTPVAIGTSAGGNGTSDNGKVVLFDTGGHLHATGSTVVTNSLGTITAQYSPDQILLGSTGSASHTILGSASGGNWQHSFQNATGTVAHVHEINVKDAPYNAKGDTKRLTDAVANGTTSVTSASAVFVNATVANGGDIGKAVFGIKTSDGSAIIPMGTIVSVPSSTSITVSVAATGSQTGVYLVYGTDDTTAIQEAGAAADAMSPKGAVYIPSGGYMFSDRLFNPASSTSSYSVRGSGSASTVFYPTPTHALTGTYYFNTLSSVQNTHYSGFTIDGSSVSAAAEAVIVGGDGTRMEDVEVHRFRGVAQGIKLIGSEATLTNCWADFIYNGNGITVVGSNCALFDSHSGNNGSCAILILNTSQCSATGCLFDECGLSSFAAVNSTSVTLNQSLVYGGNGGASCIYVDGTSEVTVTATRATPYNAGYNGNGLEVLSGGVARIASTNLTGRGTGFGLLNNGTVYDGGNNTISTSSGTAMVEGFNSVVSASHGGTGRASHTAYGVICGGTTSTGAQQSIASVGTSGQVLTSNGVSALPTFQNAASSGHTISEEGGSALTTRSTLNFIGGGVTAADNSGSARTDVTVTRTGVYRTMWLPAAAFIPRTTNGCGIDSRESTTNKVNTDELLFDASAIEYAQIAIRMPDEWDAGTLKAKVTWTAASGSGDVIFKVAGVSLANDDVIDTAMGTAQSATDTLTATGDVDETPATSAITLANTPAAGEWVVLELSRDATAGGDTLAVDARVLGITIQYQESTTEAAAW